MLFKYDKDKYSFMNVYKELGREIFNYVGLLTIIKAKVGNITKELCLFLG